MRVALVMLICSIAEQTVASTLGINASDHAVANSCLFPPDCADSNGKEAEGVNFKPQGPFAWAETCNVERLQWNGTGFLPAGPTPYITDVLGASNRKLAERLMRNELLAHMGNATCTPSRAANIRSGISEMKLRDYVDQWMTRPVSRNPQENRYVFGEFGEQWAPLRNFYVRPPCRSCADDNLAAITIGLGGLHSGAPWHFHNAAFIEVLHGAKHIALLPPKHPAIPDINLAIRNLSQLHWHLEERPGMEHAGKLTGMQECVIKQGELLYFPDTWHHGVVNMDAYTAFVSTFVKMDPESEATCADFVCKAEVVKNEANKH